ncbi:hypothetical protein [Lentzea sp. NBRC 102530]|uniref:hypothetical protein n=1 Tax=Lentzea sp. NBRC 102530 TaxID=3032201 RepID=UPI0024A5724D|nr:hypothetical protein [Lentzea sp. NBRC 102530]GLY47409.1 hypothetical protein Lesp01_10650 [Lentzea sp. NBRC 102530]
MTTELDEPASRQVRATALENLDNAVCSALSGVGAEDARRGLEEALAACSDVHATVSPQVLGSVKAAGEHLRYGERMEARMLLTVAHRLLSRRSHPVVLPGPREVDRVNGSVRG